MRFLRCGFVLAVFIAFAPAAHAQGTRTEPAPTPPSSPADVGPWDVLVVRRAEAILSSPEVWDRADTGDCHASAKTFSILCALQEAVDGRAAMTAPPRRAAVDATQPPSRVECRFHAAGDGREGTCGLLWEELPIFTISRAKAITSGTWRTDRQPTEVWAGTMSDAGSPVLFEARQLVASMTTKKYSSRLTGYNNDSSTTFANVREYFRTLEDRVSRNGGADLSRSSDDVEIEIYVGGTGVIRTYTGWYAVSNIASTDTSLRFQVDTAKQIPPNALDRAILQRAATIITSDSVWNRADNRKCPATATTWSIYCAVEKASIELAGGFHHRRPAQELVRVIVEERTKDKKYSHRMMDYNNDPSTRLQDVQSLLAEAIARIK
jgi:hypothetical protein